VELFLNAKDIRDITYDVTYGTKTFLSQILLVFKISGCTDLSPNTSYTFTVTATDLAGNQAAINPIVRITTTSSQLSCSATDTAAQEVCLMLDIIILSKL
jgi:hypothetical protein